MNQLTIKTADGETLKVTHPTSWNELTVRQGILLESKKALYPLEVVSILTGLNLDIVENQSEELEVAAYAMVYNILHSVPDWEKLTCPPLILIGKSQYPIPKIQELSLGQSIMLTEYASNKDAQDFVPHALAIYLQPIIDKGKFDRFRIEPVKELVMDMPILHAVGLLNFFLSNFKRSRSTTLLGLLLTYQILQHRQPTTVRMRSLESFYGLIPSLENTQHILMTTLLCLSIVLP